MLFLPFPLPYTPHNALEVPSWPSCEGGPRSPCRTELDTFPIRWALTRWWLPERWAAASGPMSLGTPLRLRVAIPARRALTSGLSRTPPPLSPVSPSRWRGGLAHAPQFQKRLRLIEVRRWRLALGKPPRTAALAVGYGSAPQFTRKYRRMVGLPPNAGNGGGQEPCRGVDGSSAGGRRCASPPPCRCV